MSKEADKQVTKWGKPSDRMEARFLECPECHTIGHLEHDEFCKKPAMEHRHVKTTQFGPCNFGDWCQKMRDLLFTRGLKTCIQWAEDQSGQIALFEV